MGERIYLAGGCFWGLEEYLSRIDGVTDTEVGYANGEGEDPTYEEVCGGTLGFAETVEVSYDPRTISLNRLLEAFFSVIDPTSRYRQGNDRGVQYRTGIYYVDSADQPVIEEFVERRRALYTKGIVTEVEPLRNFYRAEDYHQDYLKKHPHGYCHIDVSRAAAFCAASGPAEDERSFCRERYIAPPEEELRDRLTDMQYRVTRENATEPPFSNEYFDEDRRGIYVDIVTGEPLFSSEDKFDSGCGWPAFARPLSPDAIEQRADHSHGMVRTEVRSRAGDSHLGHVFADGPAALGGLRYCINSAALRFIPCEEMEREGYGELKAALKW